MQHVYDPFIMRRIADGRIFFVNPQMPFEHFVNCFNNEQPFFLVSQLSDGRIAITPNALFFPQNYQMLLQAGDGPQELLPSQFEYVTIKNGTYPLILTAHPVARVDEWLRNFERWVKPWAQQTLQDFISTSHEFKPYFEEEKAMFPREKVPTI